MTDTGKPAAHLQIIATADGSNTIYNTQVGENYHSRNGALQESIYVFIKAGLTYFLDTASPGNQKVNILEVGFGTGLNFLLTANACNNRTISLNYTGIEAYPLSQELIGSTGYNQYIPADIWHSFLENYRRSQKDSINLSANCNLQIAVCTLSDFETAQRFDIIYYDAFDSASQPEMWDGAAINHTLKFLKPGGVFVTYAITGNLKRTIKAAGLTVQKLPGAPGKREMLRALKVV